MGMGGETEEEREQAEEVQRETEDPMQALQLWAKEKERKQIQGSMWLQVFATLTKTNPQTKPWNSTAVCLVREREKEKKKS